MKNTQILLILLLTLFCSNTLLSQDECGNPIRLCTVEFSIELENKNIPGMLILGELPGQNGFKELSIELNNANLINFPYKDFQGQNSLFQKEKLLWLKISSNKGEMKIGYSGSAWFTTETDFVFAVELLTLNNQESKTLTELLDAQTPAIELSVLNPANKKDSIIIKTSNKQFLETLRKLLCDKKIVEIESSKDLDGDGKPENIEFSISPDRDSYELKVNGLTKNGEGEEIQSHYKIVDIDKADNFLEIAILEDGPSDDPFTSYYFYNGKELVFMGKIEGHETVSGTGKVNSRTRGNILHTWHFMDSYKLSKDHQLLREEKDLYLMNSKVVCQNYLPLYKSRNSTEVLSEITPEEKLTITYTDNKEWCCVEDDSGVRGWFALENFNQLKGRGIDINDVFDGLVNTD